MTSIHKAALSGFSSASQYDTHRPSYPQSAVSALLSALKVSGMQGARIIDLAAGTGKFTELLAARDEGFEIVALEPHDGMREELVRKQLRGVTVGKGTAEDMGVEEQWADAVIIAQAFHWFAHDAALREIYKSLVPGGSLGLIWNIEDYNAPKSWQPTTEWEAKMKDIVWSFDDSQPRFRHEKWREVFEKQLSTTPFGIQSADPLFSLPLGEQSEKFTYWLTAEAVWQRFHSLSQISVLEGEELTDTRRKVFEALEGPDVEKIEKGEVALHGHTTWAFSSAIPGAPLKEGG
ncbi:MAG: hypothetical protein HETSPECPRED_005598 [Heterodermia speciosa]|uniref:Methyltransferase type 11 domain-containing protein n=1 Tax=Heterodermia speciosa TaxID=116794 RepID=A0A8H3ISK6_9LECA|nr:MAG: hypothetical protein HETSPECPRED_005598 [Heterodermia speciosa]